MSRPAGKVRDAAGKRLTRTSRKGEQMLLERQEQELQFKADSLLVDSSHHALLVSNQDRSDIHASVKQLEQQAQALTDIRNTHKELEPVEEQSSSDIEEDEDTASRIGSSSGTMPYTNVLSPSVRPSMNGKSPLQTDQPPIHRFTASPVTNPHFQINPPPTLPSGSANPADPLAVMQSMFAQQAIANRQQQEAMMQQQALFSRQQSETAQQLQLLLAKQLDRQMDYQHEQMQQQQTIVQRQAIADARVAIKQMREGTNIVQYLEHFELELGDAQIPLAKWKKILVGKMSVKAEKVCAHLINSEATYQDIKRHLLANIGPSPDELCNIMHGAVHTEFNDKTEAQKLQHSKYVTERYFLGITADNSTVEYVAVRLFKFHCHRRFSHQIKLSKTHSFSELLEMATVFDSQLDYEKTSKQLSNSTLNNKTFKTKQFCNFCKRQGHVEDNCFKKQGTNKPEAQQPLSTTKVNSQDNHTRSKYTKYQHKDTGVKSRPVNVNWGQTTKEVSSIKGSVNGHIADIILDTGAQVTVVPGKYIFEDNLTGETIDIVGINGSPKPYQLADIPIVINDTEVVETVAVAPESQLNSKVLLATPMCDKITTTLINSYLYKNKQQQEVQVNTRQQTSNLPRRTYTEQLSTTYHEDDRASDLSYSPSSDSDDSSDETFPDDPHAPLNKRLTSPNLPSSPLLPQNQTQSNPILSTEPYSSDTTSKSNPILSTGPYCPDTTSEPNPFLNTEPYSSDITSKPNPSLNTEPYSSDPTYKPKNLKLNTEPYSSGPTSEPHSSTTTLVPESSNCLPEPNNPISSPELNSSNSENNSLTTDPKEMPIERLPELPINTQGTTTQVFKRQVKEDPTLKVIRGLAHHHKNGYGWEDGLVVHITTDHTIGERKRLVVPKPQRQDLIRTAHDRSGHFSLSKTKAILNDRFTWPGLSNDVREYIMSCETCKKYNKQTHKPAPYHNRPVISEPFDEIALDIIGPLPRSKQGYRYALTAICMASRWPEVYPIKNTKTENIVEGLIQFISRNGIPSKVLTDQGTQFMSEAMTQTCQLMGITHITTIPYRPQGNGILERFHGTLKPLLAKIASKSLDWAQFLPIALSAIHAIPCRSTGFSPAEVVFGRNTRNILDIVYEGWVNPLYAKIDISTWVQLLQDKLEMIRDVATLNNQTARLKQNAHGSHSRSHRSYKQGDLVFTRIPGCRANLQASWEGPFEVIKFIPPLNYEIQDADHTWTRTTHINNLKSFKAPPVKVQAASLVAEENTELTKVVDKGPSLAGGPCVGYSQGEMDQLLHDYEDVFSPTPREALVRPFEIKLQQDALPSSRPPYQVPIHLREEVNTQIDQLLNNNIIEISNSTDWCSPIVPVRKPDKSIRLCVDYRELNKITPLDRHMIPTLPEILDRVGHAQCLSKIDLISGFHQITVEPNSRDFTTFLSPKGKFRFIRMPFGLKNAPSHFQRAMEKVLAPVADCAAIYIDDIIIFSPTWQQHLSHIERVFTCFKNAGLTAKISKCEFGKTKLQYLGHVIGSGQMAVPEHRVLALAEYKRPISKKTLRSFLGCMSYYRRFIPKYADMSAQLTPSTSVSAPKIVTWTEGMDKAFNLLRVSLCHHVSLTIPSVLDYFTLHTDASGFGIGACLHVIRDEQELPVAFFSRQLHGAERRYSITELETLAIVAAIKHFQFYTYGTSLQVITDHKACTALLNSTALNTRLKRMALFLQDKDINITYRPGGESANADSFSRQFDDSPTKDDTNSSSPDSLPQLEAAGGYGRSGASPRTPPNTSATATNNTCHNLVST